MLKRLYNPLSTSFIALSCLRAQSFQFQRASNSVRVRSCYGHMSVRPSVRQMRRL